MMHIEAIAIKFYRVNVGSDTPVTLAVAAINLLWSFPIAYMTVTNKHGHTLIWPVPIAYIPLLNCGYKIQCRSSRCLINPAC